MPELPEVETVRRGLAPVLEGARLAAVEVRRPDLRFPFPDRFAERLTGATITTLGRRAKYLQADLSTGDVLVMHLGMSGSFRIEDEILGDFHIPRSKLAAHDHVVLTVSSGPRVIYNDPRRFGFMLLIPRAELAGHALFRDIGIEPLGNALSGDLIRDLFARKAAPLKAALLDQSLIAGLGNIYVCEAMHRAHVGPTRAAGSLSAGEAEALAQAIRDVLAEAIAAGGSSLRDHVQASGELGYFQHAFHVYDRAGSACPTPHCAGTIERIVQSNRSTFFCPVCQH